MPTTTLKFSKKNLRQEIQIKFWARKWIIRQFMDQIKKDLGNLMPKSDHGLASYDG